VLKGVDEVTALLEDVTLTLGGMAASPAARPFAEDVRAWERRLAGVGEALEAWLRAQRKWLALEPVFAGRGSADIRARLPAEAKRFDSIDRCAFLRGGLVVGQGLMGFFHAPRHHLSHSTPLSSHKQTNTHSAWQGIMRDTAKNPLVLDACSADGRCARACGICVSNNCT
jgi:dynein heavy chain